MHFINCYFLLSKVGFCFDICLGLFFWQHSTDAFIVNLLCEMLKHCSPLTIFYLIKIVIFMPNGGGRGLVLVKMFIVLLMNGNPQPELPVS